MTEPQRQAAFWLGVLALLFLGLFLLRPILLPFVAGFAIAYLLDPVVDRLERWRLQRGLASLVVLGLFVLLVLLLILLLVPLVEAQVGELTRRVPALIDLGRRQIESLMRLAQEQLSPEDVAKLRDLISARLADVVTWVARLAESMLSSGFALANLLSLAFVTPVVSFFLLRDWKRLVWRIDSWLPRQHLQVIREQARLIDQTLAGFVRGQLLVCLLLGTYYAAALSLLGLDFGLVLGLLIGIVAFIPFIGATVGFLLSIGLAIVQFEHWSSVAAVAGIFAVGQTVEANFLTPKLVGERVHLHPVWVIFALLAFGVLFGFAGVLLAVPVAAVIGVLVRFALHRYLESGLYDPAYRHRDGEPLPPAGRRGGRRG